MFIHGGSNSSDLAWLSLGGIVDISIIGDCFSFIYSTNWEVYSTTVLEF